MNDQNPASTPNNAKPSLKERAAARLNRDTTTDNDTVNSSSLKDKAKTGLAVVGGVTIAGVAAVSLLKKRGVQGVAVDLPDVDVTTDAN